MTQITYIGIGHRCHIQSILKLNGLRNCAYPFDNIGSKFEGIIDCIETNFSNFFPKIIKYDKVYMGLKATMVDASGYRKIFRSKYFSFIHTTLLDNTVIETYKRRITRFNEYIRTTKDRVVFLRTILDNDEIDKHDNFVNALHKVNPLLEYKIIYVYDNSKLKEFIGKKNNMIIVNSPLFVEDQNGKTDPRMYKFLFTYLKDNNIFDRFDTLEPISETITLCNDGPKFDIAGMPSFDNEN